MIKLGQKLKLSKQLAFFKNNILIITLILVALFQLCISYYLYKLPRPIDAINIQLTFSPDVFKQIVQSWSEENLHSFISHYYFDFIYPVIYSTLFFILLKMTPLKESKMIIILPIISWIGDELENICDLYLVLKPEEFNNVILYIGSSMAWIKWLSIAVMSIYLLKSFFIHRDQN